MGRKYKVICVIITILISLGVFVVIPFFLNKIYYFEPPCDFFKVGYSIDSVLNYYGAVLTFIGTFGLGVVTVYQNHNSQKKSDQINALTMKLQEKTIQLQEEEYNRQKEQEEKKFTPSFEVMSCGTSAQYMDIRVKLKNISSENVSDIRECKIYAKNSNRRQIMTSYKYNSLKTASLAPQQEIEVIFSNLPLSQHIEGKSVGEKNVTLYFEFQCKNSLDNEYRCVSHIFIEDTQYTRMNIWHTQVIPY